MYSTEYIVLRKTPFRESSLIVSGLSPEFGRLDFVIRGARSAGRKQFPVAGLFRLLRIEFRQKSEKSNLLTAGHVELLQNYDAIAEHTAGYLAGCSLAGDILANTKAMVEAPGLFCALQRFIETVIRTDSAEPVLSLVYLMMLQEAGELPMPGGRGGDFVEKLLTDVRENRPIPETIPSDYWEKLIAWRKVICRKLEKNRHSS